MSEAAGTAAPAGQAGRAEFNLRDALQEMVRASASDLHLKVGRPPVLRINGELSDTRLGVLRPEDLKRCAEQTLSPRQREEFAERKEIDFAIGVQGLGRFRANIFQQRGTLGMAFRADAEELRGRIAEQRGDTTAAIRGYRNLVDLWRDADPELQPRVAVARAALARLEGR